MEKNDCCFINQKLAKFNKDLFRFFQCRELYPADHEGKKDLEYFKCEAFYKVAILFIVLGFLPICYGAYMFFKENHIIAGVFQLLIYFVIFILLLGNRINILNKRYIFVLLVFLLGLMLLFTTGPMGAGLIVMVSTLGLSACLLSKRQSIILMFISLLVFIIISIFLQLGLLDNLAIYSYKESWYIVAISAQFMGVLFLLVINNLFSKIENQILEIEERANTIEESQKKYKLLFDLSGVSIGYYSPEGTIISLNRKAAENMGGLPEDFFGKSIYGLFPKAYGDLWAEHIRNTLSGDTPEEYEDLVPFITGEKWLFNTYSRIVNSKGDVTGVQNVSIDITARKQAEEELFYSSYHDALTNLYNRKYYEEEKARIDKEEASLYSIIIIDINGLHLVNETSGYDAGDRLVIGTSKVIQNCCNNDELFARTGGDEFSILKPSGEDEAEALIRLIKSNCHEYNQVIKNKEQSLSISIGYGIKTASKSINDAEKEAVESLYKNKMFKDQSRQNAIITSIMATLFEKSHETKEHAERIASYSRMIGEKIGLSQNLIDQLHLFSILHDIGKIGIDDRILNKPDKLTSEEWIEMKKHPEIGYRIAMSTIELKSSAEFILTHHERWDGKGYPQGLSGEEIPLLSRILGIADAYDAMTEDRIYRKAMAHEEAVAEIIKNKGTQFDPRLAQLFVELIQKE